MRDILKSEVYYKKYIDGEVARFQKFRKLYDEVVNEPKKQMRVAGYLANYCWNVLTAEYSLGCDKQEMMSSFKEYLSWASISRISNYAEYVDMLSLSILFDIPYEDIKGILDQQQFGDALTECLIDYLRTGFYVIKQSVDLQFSKAYDAFTDFLAEKNVEEFNDFMNNKWYDLNQDAYWYDSHKSKENIYAGYWCWLAAAVLKMVGMTSEGKYIPRDLI